MLCRPFEEHIRNLWWDSPGLCQICLFPLAYPCFPWNPNSTITVTKILLQCRRCIFNLCVRKIPCEGMATPRVLAWEIPQKEEPGMRQSKGSQGVRHDLVTKQ